MEQTNRVSTVHSAICLAFFRVFPIVLFMQGCSPIVESVTLRDMPAKPEGYRVTVYREGQTPSCPYEEIGRVTSVKRVRSSMEKTMEGLTKRAAAMGGDAVVGLAIKNEGSEIPFRDPTILGTVVVFTNASCRQ